MVSVLSQSLIPRFFRPLYRANRRIPDKIIPEDQRLTRTSVCLLLPQMLERRQLRVIHRALPRLRTLGFDLSKRVCR